MEKGVAAVLGEKWAERLRFMLVVAIFEDGRLWVGNRGLVVRRRGSGYVLYDYDRV